MLPKYGSKVPTRTHNMPSGCSLLTHGSLCTSGIATGDTGQLYIEGDTGLLSLEAERRDTHPQANSF